MRYASLDEFLRTAGAVLGAGPAALIFVEDNVEVERTIRHHAGLGFRRVVVFGPADFAMPEDLAGAAHFVPWEMGPDEATERAVNRVIEAAPGAWLYYCYNAEFLFFPFCETRSVGEMLAFHEGERREAMLTYVVDLYATDLAAHPNGVAPDAAWLDRAGYFAHRPRLDEVHRRRAEEARDEEVGGLVVEFHRRADLHHLAVLQHDDLVGERHRLDLVVGDVDHRGAQVLVQLADLHPHVHAQRRVEVRQRLVEQEDLGVAHDGAPDGHALALAARKLLGRRSSRCSICRMRAASATLRSFSALGAVDGQSEGHVLAHGHVREDGVGLEHHGDAALLRRQVVDHLPSISSVPEVMSSSPAIIRRSVDLPQPEGPTKTTNSPSAMSMSTPLMTSTAP
jgi:hypothetical protein